MANTTPRTEPVRVLADRYELSSRIGAGGMAEVWRAHDRRLDRDVAVKLLPGHAVQDPARRRRIEREARTLASVSDPNIVAVYDYGEEETPSGDVRPYLVMELVDGPDLHQYLQEHGRLDPPRAAEILGSVASAVARAHDAGIVHGDLKPANIFVDGVGPKVGDFGVARVLDEETGSTTLAATPAFAAPEVLRGAKPTPASDVYSLACLAFEMLIGRPPYEGANAWEVASKHLEAPIPSVRVARPDVPVELDETIRQSMQKDPRKRPASAAAFAGRLGVTSQTIAVSSVGAMAVEENKPATEALPTRPPDPGRVALFGPFAGAAARFGRRMRRRPPTPPDKRSRGVLWAIAIGLTIAFLILLASLRTSGTTARVPDVRGQTQVAATAAIQKAGLAIAGVSYEPVTQGRAGVILRTLPPAGQTVERGTKVHLIASAIDARPTAAPTVAPTVAPVVQPPAVSRDSDEFLGRGRGNGKGKGNDDD